MRTRLPQGAPTELVWVVDFDDVDVADFVELAFVPLLVVDEPPALVALLDAGWN